MTDAPDDLEKRVREKWMKEQARSGSDKLGPTVEFHMFTRQIEEGGNVDTYWRFDRLQGSDSTIHREYNSKALAMMELERLRKEGFTVHVVKTPEHLSLEEQAKNRAAFQAILDESKDEFEFWRRMIASRQQKEGDE